MQSSVTLGAAGLYTQPNNLELPDGALTKASNVIIQRQDVIEPRRGFKLYGNAFGSSSDRLKQVFFYKERILRHFASSLQFDTGKKDNSGTQIFSTFSGTFSEPQAGRRIRSVESNGNFYFTTSDGIKKISAASSSDFTTDAGFVTQAGGVKALDAKATLQLTQGLQSGFLPQDSAVAYRIVWGINDANKNLILGTPSPRAEVYNYFINSLLLDYNTVLSAVQNTADQTGTNASLISDSDYISTLGLPATASAAQLFANLKALAEKLDLDIKLAAPAGAPLSVASVKVDAAASGNFATVTLNVPTKTFLPADVNVGTNTVTVNAHGILQGSSVVFTTSGTLPSGLLANTTYYVGDVTTNTFRLYSDSTLTTLVSLVSQGTGTHSVLVSALNYFAVNQGVYVDGLPSSLATGTLNGAQTVTSVTYNTITFKTTATAPRASFGTANVKAATPSTFLPAAVSTSTYKITFSNPPFTSGAAVQFSSSGSLPAPLVSGSTYYLGNVTTTDFQVYNDASLSTQVQFTTQGTGTHTIRPTSTNLFTITNHGFTNGNPVVFSSDVGSSLPSPLVAGTVYYTGSVTTNTFKIFADSALTNEVQMTNVGSGTNQISYSIPVTNASLVSNIFRAIPVPVSPGTTPNDNDLLALQTYVQEIITALQDLPTTGTSPVLNSSSLTAFINPLVITTTANVSVSFTIPQGVTTSHFYQVYRSAVTQATGVSVLSELIPSDEMQLVFEAFPTSSDLSAGRITISDTTPDSFRGANLYTNPSSGEGIANANDVPPFALDVNRFKNVIFFANTKTRYRLTLTLLGVSNMLNDYNAGTTPKITISNGIQTNTYSFIAGKQQVSQITCVADVANSLNGKYFLVNAAGNEQKYYVWYKTSGASNSDPAIAGRTGIKVYVNTGDSAANVALKTISAILGQAGPTLTPESVSSGVLKITTVDQGYTDATSAGTSGFTISTLQVGQGQDLSQKQILLSTSVSPAIAVDETAKSLIEVLNGNGAESVYAYYLSTSGTVPGRINIESRNLSSPQFYIVANNANTGASFNPDLSPAGGITSITVTGSGQPLVTTSIPHGLSNGQQVVLTNTQTTPSIDGLWTVTYVNATQFSLTTGITVGSTSGSFITAAKGVAGSNEQKQNRIYYSKFQQPEAVPIANYLDVGDADKPILRIFPLRDSLFVFKADGLYRISGEVSPFNVALFDSSCILTAPDSVAVAKNIVYAWTTQGVVAVSEAGISNPPISRPIDVDILKLGSSNYPNFSTATWGVGYESDNSYLVFTVKEPSDTVATIAYRYSTLTGTWTTFDKTNTCGVVSLADDKLYLGAGDTNYLEQERKSFSRLDYADREIAGVIQDGFVSGSTLKLSNYQDVSVGDSIVQTQYLTAYEYNSFLRKIDLDAGMVRSAVTSIGFGLQPVVTTATPHYLESGDKAILSGTNTTPNIDGTYEVTVLNATQFTVRAPSQILTQGTTGQIKYSYIDSLQIGQGANLRNAILKLANRLVKEPNLVYKPSTVSISTVSVSGLVTTSSPHNLGPTGFFRKVRISGVTGSSPSVNNDYLVTVTSPTTFTLPISVSVGGVGGSLSTLDDYVNGIAPLSGTITDISQATFAVVTSANHGLVSNRYINIGGTNSTPNIDGKYFATVINENQFGLPVSVSIPGTSGTWATEDQSFEDVIVNFDFILQTLNADPGTVLNNYQILSSGLTFETTVMAVNTATKEITLSQALDFVSGPITIYKAINATVTYAPVTFKDALNLKQIAEATMMFENKAFSTATLSFASDLLPKFNDIKFMGDGNGSFGMGNGPFGAKFFGGGSNAAPFRTYVPKNVQRCRYLITKFNHSVARESFAINGLTLSGTMQQSTRAYR